MMVFRVRGRTSQTGVRCAPTHNAGAISSNYGRASFSACVKRQVASRAAIIGELVVGAANFSAFGLKRQDNDLIVIESAEAAAAFKRAFYARGR